MSKATRVRTLRKKATMITVELVRQIPLFAELPEEAATRVAASAADIRLQAGEWFVSEGESPAFFALLQGRFEVLKRYGNALTHLAERAPGDYIGETPIMLGGTFFVSARTLEPSRLMRLEAHDFRWLLRNSAAVRSEIVHTVVERVGGVQEETISASTPPIVIGGRFDLLCHDICDFLARNRVAFEWYDPADTFCRYAAGVSPEDLPLVILPDGKRLVRPTLLEGAAALGLRTEPRATQYDVAIVGGGPAGLAAAVYGASEGLRTLLVESYATGGQAGTSSRIENYLGFPSGLSGDELADRARTQAERFGADIVVGRKVRHVATGAPFHGIELDGGISVEAHALVLATGVSYRKLDVPEIDKFLGAGVFYGAARAGARTTLGRDIVLVGGGNSAGQAAMFFSGYARKVTILVRGSSLAHSMSQYLIDELGTRDNIGLRMNAEIVAVDGRDHLERIVVRDTRTGGTERWDVDAVFVFIGADARTDWLPSEVIRDERGYVCTGRDILDLAEAHNRAWPHERDPFLLESSVPGVFAAGDVRHGSIKRVAAGVGEGSMAIAFVHTYLAALRENVPAA
jgi:thioredoxin reductase (NADPH)